jgi:hypothetical protein
LPAAISFKKHLREKAAIGLGAARREMQHPEFIFRKPPLQTRNVLCLMPVRDGAWAVEPDVEHSQWLWFGAVLLAMIVISYIATSFPG